MSFVKTCYTIWFAISAIFFSFLSSSVSAITLIIPPNNGSQDIAVTWPQQVEGNAELVYSYIQLANQYLRFFMVVLCFVALVYMWYKLMTNPAWSDDVKKVMKDTIIWIGIGLVIAMMSYTIVRLIINLI